MRNSISKAYLEPACFERVMLPLPPLEELIQRFLDATCHRVLIDDIGVLLAIGVYRCEFGGPKASISCKHVFLREWPVQLVEAGLAPRVLLILFVHVNGGGYWQAGAAVVSQPLIQA